MYVEQSPGPVLSAFRLEPARSLFGELVAAPARPLLAGRMRCTCA